jgi:hypothetical protein
MYPDSPISVVFVMVRQSQRGSSEPGRRTRGTQLRLAKYATVDAEIGPIILINSYDRRHVVSFQLFHPSPPGRRGDRPLERAAPRRVRGIEYLRALDELTQHGSGHVHALGQCCDADTRRQHGPHSLSHAGRDRHADRHQIPGASAVQRHGNPPLQL